MKDYLLQFRDQVFSGAISLYKRIFISYLLLNILIGIISALVFIPLCLKFVGWDFSDLMNLQTTMEEMNKTMTEGGNPSEVFSGLFTEINYAYLIPVVLIGLVLFPWSYNLYFTLNDHEVRQKNNSLMYALKTSFSSKVFTLLGFMILYYVLCLSSFVVFFGLVYVLMSMAKFLGILIGFIGFFFVIFFLMRFILGPTAIVHGNMSISQAFTFSYGKLTMKRAALLFLMTIVVFIVMAIIGSIAGMLVASIISRDGANPMVFFWVNQVISNLMGALLGAFIFAGASALYFRYSDDETTQEEADHLHVNS